MARLRATHEFQVVMKAAEEERPFLLPFNPQKPADEQASEMIYRSGQIRGFENLFNFLKGSK